MIAWGITCNPETNCTILYIQYVHEVQCIQIMFLRLKDMFLILVDIESKLIHRGREKARS